MNDSSIPLSRMTVVGVGLLGGSVALAIRRAMPETQIHGVIRNPEARQQAVALGIVDRAFESVPQACEGSDVVVLATPVDHIAALAAEAAGVLATDALITDVGSTKQTIVDATAKHDQVHRRFVAAHPIAGSEKTGMRHSTAELMDGKTIIITPHQDSMEAMVAKAESFWKLTGGQIVVMSPQEHDQRLAAISHVPHLIASLVALQADPESLPLVGSGWKDITRVAAGDPTMWHAICQENREAILKQLSLVRDSLDDLQCKVRSDEPETLIQWLQKAKAIRDQVE
ncbi:MAG: prephenate dehydrogenase/arogenate dehydrogenase family protein [Planctomycetota bacterium]